MDENSPQGSLDELQNVPIDSVLDEAARTILAVLPAWVSRVSKVLAGSPTANADGSGTIALPPDYLKLAKLWMEGWMRPVTETINENHPSYLHQHNKTLRGGTVKPVVAEVSNNGTRSLEYFSLPASLTVHKATSASYIPILKAEEIPVHLMDALLWKSAELAFQVMGDGDRMLLCAQRFADTVKTLSV